MRCGGRGAAVMEQVCGVDEGLEQLELRITLLLPEMCCFAGIQLCCLMQLGDGSPDGLLCPLNVLCMAASKGFQTKPERTLFRILLCLILVELRPLFLGILEQVLCIIDLPADPGVRLPVPERWHDLVPKLSFHGKLHMPLRIFLGKRWLGLGELAASEHQLFGCAQRSSKRLLDCSTVIQYSPGMGISLYFVPGDFPIRLATDLSGA